MSEREEKKSSVRGLLSLPHFGMRKGKSLMSLAVGFLIWQVIRIFIPELEIHPIYIYMYAILDIRDSSDKTTSFGKRRIKATFVALAVGLPLLILADVIKSRLGYEWMHIVTELLIIFLGVTLAISIAEKVGCKTFCGVAAAIVIILIISHSDNDPYIYAIMRATQTIIGVGVAWFINCKLFPYPGPQSDDGDKGENNICDGNSAPGENLFEGEAVSEGEICDSEQGEKKEPCENDDVPYI